MDTTKRKRLEESGFRVVTVAEFLDLTPEQSELIEIKLAFTYALRKQREVSCLSQAELAEKIGSSQSRIAKMEAGDPHVSLDLMIRALLAAGMTRRKLADVIDGQEAQSPTVAEPTALPTSNGMTRRNTPKKRVQKPQTVPV